MKKLIVTTLFIILFLVCISSEDKDYISTELPDLIEKIEKITNKNWVVEYGNRNYIHLRFKKEIMGFEHYISGPGQKEPKVVFYEFSLYIKPKINPKEFSEYRKKVIENYQNLEKEALDKIKNEKMKGSIDFHPTNKNEWELYLKYLKAENEYYDMPEYYYKNLGIKSMKEKSTSTNDKAQEKILNNAKEQEQAILNLLTKYNK